MKTLGLRIFVSSLACLLFCLNAAAQTYTPQFLGSGHQIFVSGVNDSGTSVGRIGIAHTSAVLWTPSGVMQNLGTLGGKDSEALGINNSGQVVGASSIFGFDGHAFLWTSTDGMQDILGPNGPFSDAAAINDNGQVVGSYSVNNSTIHGFLWTKVGGLQDLGSLGGSSFADGINSVGHVVGVSFLSDGSLHAFLWTAQDGMKAIDLGPTQQSHAYAINDFDQVVGDYVNPNDNAHHAFVWDSTHGIHDLGILTQAGSVTSYAFGINNSRDIVGIAYVMSSGKLHGYSVLWKKGGSIQKLGKLVVPKIGGLANGATGINSSGQIVANGGGAWLLTPQ